MQPRYPPSLKPTYALPAPLSVPPGVNGSCSIQTFFRGRWGSFRCALPPEPCGSGVHLAVPRLMSDSPCSPRGRTPGLAPAPSGAGSKSRSPRSLTVRRVTPGQQEAVTLPGSGQFSAGVWLCRWCPCHGPGVFGSSQPGVHAALRPGLRPGEANRMGEV